MKAEGSEMKGRRQSISFDFVGPVVLSPGFVMAFISAICNLHLHLDLDLGAGSWCPAS